MLLLDYFFSSFIASPVAAYNLAPIILVPQIILGGALLKYEQMNQDIMLFRIEKVNPIPPPADLIAVQVGL